MLRIAMLCPETKVFNSILIAGDSLAAHRPDGIPIQHRWPQLLAEYSKPSTNIVNKSRGSSTSRILRKLSLNDIDISIVQLGVVDCVPRYFTKVESKLIARLPTILRDNLIDYFKKTRAQEFWGAYISADEYRNNLEGFFGRCKEVVVVKILEPGEKFARSNPGAVVSIREFNSIIDNVSSSYNGVRVVSLPVEMIDSLTLDDGYHLNEEGHCFLAELLARELGFKDNQ